jgi:putative methionine-R-sulfoxide reductase with GAF domain
MSRLHRFANQWLAVLSGRSVFHRFRNIPLRRKLAISLALVALAPLSVLAWMNTERVTQLLEADTRQELTATAQQDADRVDGFVRSQMDSLRLEAQLHAIAAFASLTPQKRPGSQAAGEASSTLGTLARKDPIYLVSYAILDRGGWNLMDTATERTGQQEFQHPYFQVPLESGLPYVSPVLFIESAPSIYFSSPIRGASGETVGVLRAEYNASILQSLLTGPAGAQAGQGLYSVLIDDEHYIRLAHSIDPFLLYKSYAPLTASQISRLQTDNRLPEGAPEELTTNQPGVVEGIRNGAVQPFFTTSAQASALGGDAAITTAVHLQEAPWIILVRQSQSVALAPIQEQTRSSVMLALLAMALVAGAAVVVSQAISAPILQLTQAAEKVAGGDLEARAQAATDDEIGALARAFNAMTGELQDTLRNLEARVAERTRALELSSDVSRRLSTILDPVRLVSEVVELLQDTFHYYHAQIYLFDERKENLVMVGGTGESGQQMLERGHSLPRGRGLVGRACESGAEVLVADTLRDPSWLSNPLLPETRSEIAMPIMAGREVLGALDVQHNRVEGLGRQDADLLRGIASQVAIALQNANRFTQAQHRAERERTVAAILQQIQNTHTASDALQVAARELGRALHAPRIRAGLHGAPGENGTDRDQPDAVK